MDCVTVYDFRRISLNISVMIKCHFLSRFTKQSCHLLSKFTKESSPRSEVWALYRSTDSMGEGSQGCPQVGVGGGGRFLHLPMSFAPPYFFVMSSIMFTGLIQEWCISPLLLPMRPLLQKLQTALQVPWSLISI